MKKLTYIFLALFLLSCGSDKVANFSTDSSTVISSPEVTVQSILSNMENAAYKEGELLVKFKSGVSATASLSSHQATGATVAKRFTIVPELVHVSLAEGMSVSDAILQYMSDPNVEYAEPNYIMHLFSTMPNDTYFGQQWSLHNTGTFAGGFNDADIDAPEAWDISRGSSNVIVAVADSGVNYNHEDLAGNMWTNPGETNCTNGIDDDLNTYVDDCIGWDFVGSDISAPVEDNDPMDELGHGTHVSGTIGAVGNNNTGVSGVMWNVKIMPLKIGDSTGGILTSAAVSAVDYAVLKGASVINASFGGSAFSTPMFDAINAANSSGVLFVAAAGNGGADGVGDNNDLAPVYPASYNLPNIISVAATDQHDWRVSFSNFGPNSVHVGAPGVYVFSTVLLDTDYGVLDFFSGTSMAAPHVTGLAGLLSSYYTAFSHSQIRSTILTYVDVLSDLTGWVQTNGRINADRALRSLYAPTNLTATATTMSSIDISLSWSDNATGEGGYTVERKVSGGSFATVANIGPDSTTYQDAGLDSLTSYTYRVKASNAIGDSFYSNEAIIPVAPSNLSATAVSSSQVDLSWTDNSNNETGFKIERKTGSGGTYSEIATVGANVTAYNNTGLDKRTYFYRVRAYTGTGNSAYSNEDSATTGSGSSKGPGSNCSIGARQNTPTALASIAVMLVPLVFITIMRRKRKYQD